MIAPLASPAATPDARRAEAAAWKAEHALRHAAFLDHERACPDCQTGQACRQAASLAGLADDCGKRWKLAEERRAAQANQGTDLRRNHRAT